MANVTGVKKRNGVLEHICNDEIFIFDFKFDEQHILDIFNRDYRGKGTPYVDPRLNGMDEIFYGDDWGGWLIHRDVDDSYIWSLCELFNVNASPRFFLQVPGFDLPQHKDHGTQCSLNFLIGGKNPAPLRCGKNVYYYKTALLNVQEYHGVDNPDEERLLLKLAIQDEDYHTVRQKVVSTLPAGI